MLTLWLIDVCIISGSVVLASSLAFLSGGAIFEQSTHILFGVVTVLALSASMVYFKLYERMWRYASIDELVSLFKAVTAGLLISYVAVSAWNGTWFSIPVLLFTYQSVFLLIGGSRLGWRVYRKYVSNRELPKLGQRVAVIVGAGDCGSLIAREMLQNPTSGMRPVAFIDDDPVKQKRQIQGLPVYGNTNQIEHAVKAHAADDIVIAMPSVSRKQVSHIIERCKQTKASQT